MNEFIDIHLGNDDERKARAIAAEKAKREKMLSDASKKPIRLVFQLDHFCEHLPGTSQDPHNDMYAGWQWELRRCEIPVRVQVLHGTSPAKTIKALRDMADWIERKPDLMKEPPQPPIPPAEPAKFTF